MQSEENQGAESQDNATNMADLSTVEDRDIVKVFRRADGSLVRDSDGNFIVLLVPAMVPSDDGAWENAYQLFLRDTEEFRDNGYRVIYVHSGFSPPLWFTWWLREIRLRLSRSHRKNIQALSVIHPSIALRLFLFALRPVLGANFWAKLHYADRLEELWLDDIVSESDAVFNIPRLVSTYEGKIVQEAEAMRSLAVIFGAPLGPRERPGTSGGDDEPNSGDIVR